MKNPSICPDCGKQAWTSISYSNVGTIIEFACQECVARWPVRHGELSCWIRLAVYNSKTVKRFNQFTDEELELFEVAFNWLVLDYGKEEEAAKMMLEVEAEQIKREKEE